MTKNKATQLANNCKALSNTELSFINDKYQFWIDNNDVCVKCKNRARITRHPKALKFAINVKHIRKITYSPIAIEMFENFQKDVSTNKFSLTDIQNALNICRITYQPMTVAQVQRIIESKQN